jgi:hypothetical protein
MSTEAQEPEWLFPFDGMEAGDSFFIPTLRPAQIIMAVNNGAKRAKLKIIAYVTQKEGNLGVRVWRVN